MSSQRAPMDGAVVRLLDPQAVALQRAASSRKRMEREARGRSMRGR